METSSPEVQEIPDLKLISGMWHRAVWYVDASVSDQPNCRSKRDLHGGKWYGQSGVAGAMSKRVGTSDP